MIADWRLPDVNNRQGAKKRQERQDFFETVKLNGIFYSTQQLMNPLRLGFLGDFAVNFPLSEFESRITRFVHVRDDSCVFVVRICCFAKDNHELTRTRTKNPSLLPIENSWRSWRFLAAWR